MLLSPYLPLPAVRPPAPPPPHRSPDLFQLLIGLVLLLPHIIGVPQSLGLVTDCPVPLAAQSVTQLSDTLPLHDDLIPLGERPVPAPLGHLGLLLSLCDTE